MGQLMVHTYYLLPLCLDALNHCPSFANWMIARNYLVQNKLTSPEDQREIETMHNWVMAQNPPKVPTHTHTKTKEAMYFLWHGNGYTQTTLKPCALHTGPHHPLVVQGAAVRP